MGMFMHYEVVYTKTIIWFVFLLRSQDFKLQKGLLSQEHHCVCLNVLLPDQSHTVVQPG